MNVWISAARPKTLPAAVAPVIIGTAIAYHVVGQVDVLSFTCALIGAIVIQIGSNFANDYYDFVKGTDTADRIGPPRATQSGAIKPATMRLAYSAAFALALVPGAYIVYRGGIPYLVIGSVSIVCGILYTGGPFPLGYLGLGDVFVLIFFGPVAVCGTYYLHALQLTYDVFIASLAPGLISTALLTVNNLRDVDQDNAGGKRTLAVRFGRTFARAEYTACIFVACAVVPIYFTLTMRGPWFLAIPAVCAVFARMPLRAVWKSVDGPTLNNALAATGRLLLVFSGAFSLCWIL